MQGVSRFLHHNRSWWWPSSCCLSNGDSPMETQTNHVLDMASTESNTRADCANCVYLRIPERTHSKYNHPLNLWIIVTCLQDLHDFIKATADRINTKYRDVRIGYLPLHYIESTVLLHDKLAYYSLADVVVVTATRDGMNLVPYEYIVCRQGAPQLADGERTSMLVVSGAQRCSGLFNASMFCYSCSWSTV